MSDQKFIGRIYKISSLNTDNIYVGSTTETLRIIFTRHCVSYNAHFNEKNMIIEEVLMYSNMVMQLLNYCMKGCLKLKQTCLG